MNTDFVLEFDCIVLLGEVVSTNFGLIGTTEGGERVLLSAPVPHGSTTSPLKDSFIDKARGDSDVYYQVDAKKVASGDPFGYNTYFERSVLKNRGRDR